ncbi:hypothetical protein [uncultured Brevundimonas sp.]|uniref:hypothetical protein n=1 Tax=uncultured Brevundimonas sp. TaxID=213418 RepID=UPI0030EF212B|tara:strand:+ start:1937 stop:2317 length:381 start_codon:yes stop_codon:yes gene_type:complete
MPEKKVRYGKMSPREFADRVREMLGATGDMPPDEVEQRSRATLALARAAKVLDEVEPAGGAFDTDDDQLDAAGEQRLRDELLHRIVALNADLEAEEGAGEPEPDSAEADRERLGRLVASGAATAPE